MATATGTTVLDFKPMAYVATYTHPNFTTMKKGGGLYVVNNRLWCKADPPEGNVFLIYIGESDQATLVGEVELNRTSTENKDPIGVAFLTNSGNGYVAYANNGNINLTKVTGHTPNLTTRLVSTSNNTWAAGDILKFERTIATGAMKFYLNGTEVGSFTDVTVTGNLKPALYMRRNNSAGHGGRSFGFTGATLPTTPYLTTYDGPMAGQTGSQVTLSGINLTGTTSINIGDGTRSKALTTTASNTATAITLDTFDLLATPLRAGANTISVTATAGTSNVLDVLILPPQLPQSNLGKQVILTSYDETDSGALKPAAGQPPLAAGQAILYGALAYADEALTTLTSVRVYVREDGTYQLGRMAVKDTTYYIAHYRQIGTDVWSSRTVSSLTHSLEGFIYSSTRADVAELVSPWEHLNTGRRIGIANNEFDLGGSGSYARARILPTVRVFAEQHTSSVEISAVKNSDFAGPAVSLNSDGSGYALVADGRSNRTSVRRIDGSGTVTTLSGTVGSTLNVPLPPGTILSLERGVNNSSGRAVLIARATLPDGTQLEGTAGDSYPLDGGQPGILINGGNTGDTRLRDFMAFSAPKVPVITTVLASTIPATGTTLVLQGSNLTGASARIQAGLNTFLDLTTTVTSATEIRVVIPPLLPTNLRPGNRAVRITTPHGGATLNLTLEAPAGYSYVRLNNYNSTAAGAIQGGGTPMADGDGVLFTTHVHSGSTLGQPTAHTYTVEPTGVASIQDTAPTGTYASGIYWQDGNMEWTTLQVTSHNVTNLALTKPTLTVTGPLTRTVEQNSTFTLPSATATDAYGVDITSLIQTTGSVDTSTLGEQTVVYRVTDARGNQATPVTLTVTVNQPVDNEKPVITLTGPNPLTLVRGATYVAPTVTVTDNRDSGLVPVITGLLNPNEVGSYQLRYNVTDAAGNAADEVVLTVNVVAEPDITRPVIQVSDTHLTYVVGSTYVPPTVTVSDNRDSNITPTTVGSVDTSTIGTYLVTYHAVDAAGNQALPVTVTVNIVAAGDTGKPIIHIAEGTKFTVRQNESFTPPAYMATDNKDGNITNQVVVTGSIDTSVLGEQMLKYNVTDSAGNKADEVTVRVLVVSGTDVESPQITIDGPTVINVYQNSTVTLPTVTATDNKDGDISGQVQVTGTMDTSTVGRRVIHYNVQDTAGNKADEVRLVLTVLNSIPTVTISGPTSVVVPKGSTYTSPTVTATDSDGTDISNLIQTTGSVDTSVTGPQTVRYTVTNADGSTSHPAIYTVYVGGYLDPKIINVDGDNQLTEGQKDVVVTLANTETVKEITAIRVGTTALTNIRYTPKATTALADVPTGITPLVNQSLTLEYTEV